MPKKKKATVHDDGNIVRVHVPMKRGHSISLFVNRDLGGDTLLVVDVVHSNGSCGNEIIRKLINVPALMRYTSLAIKNAKPVNQET